MDRIEYLTRDMAENCEDLEKFYAQLCSIATYEPTLKDYQERQKVYAELNANRRQRLSNLRAALALETQKSANPAIDLPPASV
jgi:hypothetical protein